MKRKTAKTVAAGLVVSREYWTFLQRVVLVDADARWDLLSLEAGLPTEADVEKFLGAWSTTPFSPNVWQSAT